MSKGFYCHILYICMLDKNVSNSKMLDPINSFFKKLHFNVLNHIFKDTAIQPFSKIKLDSSEIQNKVHIWVIFPWHYTSKSTYH